MIPEDVDAALEECLRETGHERFRHLVSEANTLPAPNSAEDYRRWILERGWRRTVPVDYGSTGGPTTGPCCGG